MITIGVSEELRSGMLVGRYQLLFRLGKGGMGEVWAAAQTQSEFAFQKLIALKVLRTKEMTSNAAVMFFDEAKAAAALQHASIVSTIDLGRDGDILFIAMDMVQGPSLTALLQRLVINKASPTRPAIAAYIGIQIASGLDYAHDRATFEGQQLKLVHRDISPHNVLLDLNGAIKLTDFGVARTAIQDHESRVGTVRGKPSYMAPEQVVGGDLSNRTDLFALGIVLYETCCLKRLFGRSNPVKSMDAVIKHQPKPLVEMVPDFPEPLWNVIKKALEKDPNKRFQNASEMVDALNEANRDLEGATSAPRDLVELIDKHFEADAFDTEGRVKEAMELAGEMPAHHDPTASEQSSAPQHENIAVAEVVGTQMAWPTAYAPDPLAPEAIEEARTQFRAMTPSASSPSLNMSGYTPSVDGFTPTPFTGTGSMTGMVPQKRSMTPIIALVIAAVMLVGTAAIVVTREKAPTPINPTTEPEPTTTVVASPNVKAKQKVRKPPTKKKESLATNTTPDHKSNPTPRKPPSKPAKVKTPKKPETPPQKLPPTKKEVMALIRKVKKVNEPAYRRLLATMSEGSGNEAVYNRLRDEAQAILKKEKP